MTEVEIRRYEEVRKLELKEGDILQVVLGGNLGDDLGPWIPAPEDIDYAQHRWDEIVPEGVKVIVTHFKEEPTIISPPNDG